MPSCGAQSCRTPHLEWTQVGSLGRNRLTRIHKFLTLRNMAAIHVCGDTVINRGKKIEELTWQL